MCTPENPSAMNKAMAAAPASPDVASVAAPIVQRHRADYCLVDIREPAEIEAAPFPDADHQFTMGALCHKVPDELVSHKKIITLVCNTGARAALAAASLLAQNVVNVRVLQNGLAGWTNPANVTPQFVIVLQSSNTETEKLSLALAAAVNAIQVHGTVALVLMGQGVEWFAQRPSTDSDTQFVNVQDVAVGEPFKPCRAMLHKFLASHSGMIFGCTTCVKHRRYEFASKDNDDSTTQMMDCVNPLQMPDLIRFLQNANGNTLQFS